MRSVGKNFVRFQEDGPKRKVALQVDIHAIMQISNSALLFPATKQTAAAADQTDAADGRLCRRNLEFQ
jgi:hypothetical protein